MSRALFGLVCLLAAGPVWPAEEMRDWPREHSYLDGSKLVLYQPQFESWEDHERLEGRMALAFEPAGAEKPALGAFEFAVDSETDLESRQVRLSNLRFMNGRFPSLDPLQSEDLRKKGRGRVPRGGGDRARQGPRGAGARQGLLGAGRRQGGSAQDLQQRGTRDPGDPERRADSEPDRRQRSAVRGQHELGSLLLPDAETYYLRNEESWLQATSLTGPWSPAGKLPKSFKKLSKKDENWKEVREHVPGKELAPEDVPRVFVSEVPAELILVDGEPELAFITPKLLWAKNTESDLFLSNSDGKYYYLVSGRWFRAESLDGDWTFCSTDLPKDFAEIPEDHERGDVLASVPGTPQPTRRSFWRHIPKKAKVERSEVKATAAYQGEPKFEEIEGTSMSYATNSPNDVIKVGDLYYMCFQAVWFVSTSPQGPWRWPTKSPPRSTRFPRARPFTTRLTSTCTAPPRLT